MTPTVASKILEFIHLQEAFILDRREVAHAAFGVLRRSLRRIVVTLREAGGSEALEVSDQLRVQLSEWLTVPVPFSPTMHATLGESFGGIGVIEGRWGADVRALALDASNAAKILARIESPMRDICRVAIREVRAQGVSLRIYCHRHTRQHFVSLVASDEEPLPDDVFLHSLRAYRESEPFDVLLKVGPLRPRGWGAAPDAIVSAPRFGRLLQTVWSGCSDDPEFGFDPVAPPGASISGDNQSAARWTRLVSRSGDDPGGSPQYSADEDELRVFREMGLPGQRHPATLVQVDEEHGVLYPPLCEVLCFDPSPDSTAPIRRRLPGDTLHEGMFVIMPLLEDIELGGVQAKHGDHSQAWKARLRERWLENPEQLLVLLKSSGLNLVHLDAAVRHWLRPPTTVIHAPQQMKHFEILLRALELIDGNRNSTDGRRTPFYRLAWNEIRRSRGEAIQAGVLGNEIVDEQLCTVLLARLPSLREKAMHSSGFYLSFAPDDGFSGQCNFLRVCAVEHGFSAPEGELKVVLELSVIDQWRD